jgi:hypothetical protein
LELPQEVQEALAQAKIWEFEAWLDEPTEVCGVELRQMTLQDYYFLEGIESPFIAQADIEVGDIGVFLWIMSTEYKKCSKARQQFLKKHKDIKVLRAIEGIQKYIDMTFNDCDTLISRDQQQANVPYVAYQIDLFAKQYGWTIQEILKIPLRQVIQLNTAIQERCSKQNGENYTRMRKVDALEAKAMLDQAKRQSAGSN